MVSLQISIFCHTHKKKKNIKKKNALLVSLKLDTCTACCKIKNNATSALCMRAQSQPIRAPAAPGGCSPSTMHCPSRAVGKIQQSQHVSHKATSAHLQCAALRSPVHSVAVRMGWVAHVCTHHQHHGSAWYCIGRFDPPLTLIPRLCFL